jgi:hypothetical protein
VFIELWAENGSSSPVEDISESFDNMNRGLDVITDSEKVKKLETRLIGSERTPKFAKKRQDKYLFSISVAALSLDVFLKLL